MAIFSPPPDARVVGPKVDVQLTIENFKLVTAGTPVFPGEGHAHVLIDRDPVPPGEPLPTGQADIIHLGKAPFDVRSPNLSSGQHRLVVQLADSSHKALDTPAVAETQFSVGTGPSFRGKGQFPLACAEVASGLGLIRLVFPTQGGLVQGSIDSRCNLVTEGGSCGFVDISTRRIIGTYNDSTRLLDAKVVGKTSRQLTSGAPQQCGAPIQEDHVPEAPLSAALVGSQVSGTLGSANFVVTADDAISLADPVDLTTPSTTTTSEPRKIRADREGVPVGRIALGAGAVAVMAGLIIMPLRRRMSGRFSADSE